MVRRSWNLVRTGQESTLLRGRRVIVRLTLQFFDLGFGLIQGHFLDQDRLRQDVERVGPCADRVQDQIVSIAVDLGRRCVPDPFSQSGNQLSFLFSHFAHSLPFKIAHNGHERPVRSFYPYGTRAEGGLFRRVAYSGFSSIDMKTAFLFPGQGSQFAGMGKSLAESFRAARECFEQADDALGFSLSKMCFEGPEEDLKRTEFQQPALLAVSIAAATVLRSVVGEPQYVAGHSLGEYSALVAAGSLDFGEALRLVNKRGRYMQEAVPAGVGAMAALLRLPEGKLDGILAEAAQGEIVTPAGFNSPDQIVISGNRGAVERAMELAKAAGAKRAVPLPVSAPFHCPLMKPAQERLLPDLEATRFADLRIPLINNWQAREIRTGDEARVGLYQQVPNPVRWTDTIGYLAANGVERWFEAGAGAVLSGLLRTISRISPYPPPPSTPAL